jgi:hypothetical protein
MFDVMKSVIGTLAFIRKSMGFERVDEFDDIKEDLQR